MTQRAHYRCQQRGGVAVGGATHPRNPPGRAFRGRGGGGADVSVGSSRVGRLPDGRVGWRASLSCVCSDSQSHSRYALLSPDTKRNGPQSSSSLRSWSKNSTCLLASVTRTVYTCPVWCPLGGSLRLGHGRVSGGGGMVGAIRSTGAATEEAMKVIARRAGDTSWPSPWLRCRRLLRCGEKGVLSSLEETHHPRFMGAHLENNGGLNMVRWQCPH